MTCIYTCITYYIKSLIYTFMLTVPSEAGTGTYCPCQLV